MVGIPTMSSLARARYTGVVQQSRPTRDSVSMSDPRSDALEHVSGAYDVRVLEPSPPAVNEPPWLADDPVAIGDPRPERPVVSPIPTGDVLWEIGAADLARAGSR